MVADLDQKIGKFLGIVAEITVKGAGKQKVSGFELWPFHPIRGRLFFTKSWFTHLLSYLRQLDKKGLNDEEIARAFKAPSKIAQLLWMLDGMKQADLSMDERLYIVERLFDLLGIWRKDIFCGGGRNLVWDQKQAGEVIEKARFIDLQKEPTLKQNICTFESALWMYTEMIYFSNHPLAHSFQGPYELDNKVLVVRRYFDLKPPFWSFSRKLKFDEVEILETYKRGTKIKFDFFERGVRSRESYRDKLLESSVMVGSRSISPNDELKEVLSNLTGVVRKGSMYIRGLSLQDLIAKYASYWFFALKPLYGLMGKPWQLPKEVEDNIYKRFDEINAVWQKIEEERLSAGDLSMEERAENMKKIFDPRL